MRPRDPNSLRGRIETAMQELAKFADYKDPTGVPTKVTFPIVIRNTEELQKFLAGANAPWVKTAQDHLKGALDKSQANLKKPKKAI